MLKLSIDKVIYDFKGIAKNGEDYNDTFERIGLPYNFIVEVDADYDDDMDYIGYLADEAAYDYIRKRFGKKVADGIVEVGWGVWS